MAIRLETAEIFTPPEEAIIEAVRRAIHEISYPKKDIEKLFLEIIAICRETGRRTASYSIPKDEGNLGLDFAQDEEEMKQLILTMNIKEGLPILRKFTRAKSSSLYLTDSEYAHSGGRYVKYRPASNERIYDFIENFHSRLKAAKA